MNTRRYLTLILIAGAFANTQLFANTTELSKNPFRQPAEFDDPEIVVTDESQDTANEPLELRATLVSDSSTLADVGGKIMSVGDIHLGYRLVLIQEGKAIFRNEHRELVLTVRAEDAEDNDD